MKKNIGYKAKGAVLPADDISARLAALRFVTGMAMLSCVILSLNLWFPAGRSVPRAPLVNALPQSTIPPVEYFLGGLLFVTLPALALAKRPVKYAAVGVIILILLTLLDQTRLQPWVYQCLLLLVVITLHNRQSCDERTAKVRLSAAQLIVATLYFWSGAQKLNYSFINEVLPQLLAPLQDYLSLTQTRLSVLGVVIAFVEIFIGCGLLLRQTRKLCIWLAIAMHGFVLGLLIMQGRNSVVWPWNVALILMVIISFWRSDVFIRQTLASWRACDTSDRAAQILAIICALLPALSFWGWWDMYLSGALYSGNTAVAVVRVDKEVYEKLPESAKRQVFMTKSGERMLPVYEWTMTELNVPPYPEVRVFKQIASEICKFTNDKSQVELIIKDRPTILNGNYKVIKANCLQLNKQ